MRTSRAGQSAGRTLANRPADGHQGAGGRRPGAVIVYVFDRRKLGSPIVMAAALVALAAFRSEWLALAGLPLIYLGWYGCAPNLNLADGCLPLLTTGVALTVGVALGSPGLLAAGGAGGATWVVASLESAWRCRPVKLPAEAGAPPEPDHDSGSMSS